MFSPLPLEGATYAQAVAHQEAQIHAAFAKHEYEPIIFPYHGLPFLVVLAYLLLEPSKSLIVRAFRYISFLFYTWRSVQSMRHVRSPTPHVSFAVGLIFSWSIMWLGALLIFNDVKSFKRIWPVEDVPRGGNNGAVSLENGADSSNDPSITTVGKDADGQLARSTSMERPVSFQAAERHARKQRHLQAHAEKREQAPSMRYYWQSIPASFWPRLHWILDLVCSMRAPGWAHQVRSIPAPPNSILSRLPAPHPTARPTVGGYSDTSTLLRHNLYVFLACYIALDIFKSTMIHDPYFWGYLSAAPLPSHPLMPFIVDTPILLRFYRCLISLATIGGMLRGIFSLNALVFVGVFGPDRWPLYLGIRAEPWVYPNWYGNSGWVASHGLAGWWGAWWHQIFRFGFEAPSVWFCKRLGWDRKANCGRLLSMVVAFVCSGILHASGSFTAYPTTRPISGTFMFFVLQALGTFAESLTTNWLREQGILARIPTVVKRLATTVWVAGWMTLTAPLLVDDLAGAGAWLFEPVPVSFLRLMGYRLEGQSAWAWRGTLCWWHRDELWWKSGIAL